MALVQSPPDAGIGALPLPRAGSWAGAGFKPEHLEAILADTAQVGFFEVHAENYMGAGGPPHAQLARIRRDFPISLHGVCMSLGGPQRLSREHLARFRTLVDRYEPFLVSEHLAWSTHDTAFMNDLLPLPYTDMTLSHVCAHIDEMQEAIGRTILLENPSTYVAFRESTWEETAFIGEIARRTGCGLLLDVNNVFVSCTNHGWSPADYIARFPLHRVGEIHLAGHDRQADDDNLPLLIDSHDRPVADPVWDLFAETIARRGPVATLIEWDNDIPAWDILAREAATADAIIGRTQMKGALGHAA
jgi:uncharacterized protein (UPF0276 family)